MKSKAWFFIVLFFSFFSLFGRVPAEPLRNQARVFPERSGYVFSMHAYDDKDKWNLAVSHPFSLAYIVKYQSFHMDQWLLFSGARPEKDMPQKAAVVLGRKKAAGDWVLEDEDTAIWVTGVAAPTSHNPVILVARLAEAGDSPSLQATQVLKISEGKKMTIRPGEYVFYSLPGSKSTICPVELSGASVEIVFHDEFECVILRAIKPGTSILKVFVKWWNAPEVKLDTEYELMVE